MKNKSSIVKLAAAMLFAASTVAVPLAAYADTNLVVDGNFDNPLYSGSFVNYKAGDTFGGLGNNAWLVTGNVQVWGPNPDAGVDLIGNYWSAPSLGQGSVDLSGLAPGGISQKLGSLAAGTYQLSFYLSGNPDVKGDKTVGVFVNNTSLVPLGLTYTVTSANSKTNMNWELETLNFTTNGGNTELAFTSISPNSAYGPAVAGISVTRVPEVSAKGSLAALMAVAALGLMAGERRRRVS